MRPWFLSVAAATTMLFASSCWNPFAPHLDNSPAGASSDPTTVDGFFRLFQQAYATHDTTLYGELIDGSFIFVYNDWEQGGIEKTWGRDREMSTTYGLFQTAQRLDLIWNNIISTSTDSTKLNVYRGFNLTVTFNPTDIERVDGYANLTLDRARTTDPWKMVRWRDESIF